MSIESSGILGGIPDPVPVPGGGLPAGSAAPPRNFLSQAALDTVASKGARVGLGWLLLMLLFAVFSPLLANSQPILLKVGGHWSSPLIRHLSAIDVLLLVWFFTVAALAIGRWFSPARSFSICLIVIAATTPLAFAFVQPPRNVVYEQYRQWSVEGKIQSVWRVPIPFSPQDHLRDQIDARLQPPSRVHWLGTDTNGSDLLSCIIHASHIALSIGFLSTGIAVAIGIVVGGLMGYYVGTVDLLGMRLIEVFEAVPRLLLLITVTAFVQQRNIYLMMIIIGLTGWTGYARFLRGEFLTLRKLDFVQAAVAAGLPRRLIVFRHMLINGLTPILVASTFGVAGAIITESILTFLGLGLVGETSWGGLLNQARAGGAGVVLTIAIFPGLAIFLTVFAYNLVGEGVRDALDPRLRKRD